MKALLLMLAATQAHAEVACFDGDGWALAPGASVPVHPHVAYFRSRVVAVIPELAVKIGRKRVNTKVTWHEAKPYAVADIEVDSDETGTLSLAWGTGEKVTYEIAAAKLPAEAKATTRRFHGKSEDGLEIAVDVPAIAFTARWRRDAQTPWQTLELVANQQTARLGRLGCKSNFAVSMLESGIDLELTALLADGRRVPVRGLPSHVVLK